MNTMPTAPIAPDRPSDLSRTGVPGLDDVLGGGFTKGRLYLVEGSPGTGKTTIAMQYLMEGARLGERVLYVTLSETEAELKGVAKSHGWDLTGIEVREMLPSADELLPDEVNTLFHPSEVELGQASLRILAEFERLNPTRVVFDSLSELRLLAGNSLRYRRQVLAFKQFFCRHSCTVLMLDDMTALERDLQVQSIAHAVLHLEQLTPDFGDTRRRLIVLKFRGKLFRGGYHDYRITRGGFVVFPHLVATEHVGAIKQENLVSGVKDLDALLGGGIHRGSSVLLMGAPGTGKSTVSMHFVLAAANRGECSAVFLFDESIATMRTRTEGMGMSLSQHIDSGRILVRQVDPAQLSPGEFVHEIRQAVTEHHAKVVVIDSLNGYLNAMPDERFLIVHLHELLTFLGHRGVATILIGAPHGIIGMQMSVPVDASYLADTAVLLRNLEVEGRVQQAISVMKKRGGKHDRSIRSFHMGAGGVTLGPPLRQFHDAVTVVPELWVGSDSGPGTVVGS